MSGHLPSVPTRSTRRGLVLEGGGGKGAYALGCMTALKEAGIHFDAIAGSSVGALNAAIMSTARLSEGTQLWTSLSLRAVCKLRHQLAFYLLLPLHAVGLLLHRLPIGGPPFSTKLAPKEGLAMVVGLGVIMTAFQILLTLAFWPFTGTLMLTPALPITGVFLGLCALWAAPFVVRLLGYTLFDTRPLSLAIQNVIGGATWSTPTYCTIAHGKSCFDPDLPGFYYTGGEGYVRVTAMGEEVMFPEYVRLDKLAEDVACGALLASAALPFGIFPSVRLGSRQYVDGGISDNLPIWPLLELEHCDELWVVKLRPHKVGSVEDHWSHIDRLLRVERLDPAEAKQDYREAMIGLSALTDLDRKIEPPINVPFRTFPPSIRTVVIAPERSIGGFVNGTMRFERRYARRLIARGRADARRVIQQAMQ